VAPLFFRLLSILKQRVVFGMADVAGIFSDLFVAGVLALIVSWVPFRRRGAALAALGILGLALSFANYEHIRVLGSGLDFHGLKFLGSSQFVRGSIMALNPFSGAVIAAAFLFGSICLISANLAKILSVHTSQIQVSHFRLDMARCLTHSIVIFMAAIFSNGMRSQVSLAHSWRTYNLVELNVVQVYRSLWPDSTQFNDATVSREFVEKTVQELNARDLSGEKFVTPPAKRPNILLVTLEGLSGGYLVSADYSDQKCNYLGLPRFREIARRGIHYTNFVAHNRQTNRGQYSLLCGQYPNLMSDETKPDVMLSDESRANEFESCLPSILRKQGYRTDYLQAAELSFMSKDRLMPRLGFETVDGKNWFPHNESWVGWGPDDRTFLSRSLERIDSLQQSKQPWFLTLMTSGTHHPYAVPEGFSSRYPQDSMQAALELLDSALVEFFDGLQTRGIFEDTLVIVTADESSGCDTGTDVQRALSQAWAPLVVFEPRNRQAKSIEAIFSQRDLEISVLDYLDISQEYPTQAGRSIFRHYASPGPVAFGNYYAKRVGLLWGIEHGMMCDFGLQQCEWFERPSGAVYPDYFVSTAESSGAKSAFLEFQKQNDLKNGSRTIPRSAVLAEPSEMVIYLQQDEIVWMGHQYWSVPASTQMEIEVEVEATNGDIELSFDLTSQHSSEELVPQKRILLHNGERFHFEARYLASKALVDTEARLKGRVLGNSLTKLKFHSATLRSAQKWQ